MLSSALRTSRTAASDKAFHKAVRDVEAAFKHRFKRGRRPSAVNCFRLATAIIAIRNAPRAKASNSDPRFKTRLAAYNSFKQLVEGELERERIQSLRVRPRLRFLSDKKLKELVRRRVERWSKPWPELRLQRLVHLEALNEMLAISKAAVLNEDPLAGRRVGAEWHKPARYLGRFAEEAVVLARGKASWDKGGPLVQVLSDLLLLAGEKPRSEQAIAALFKSTS